VIRDPEITIGIFAHTKGTPASSCAQIKYELETNDRLKKSCPDVFWASPPTKRPKWSIQDGLIVKRKHQPQGGDDRGQWARGRHADRRSLSPAHL
jgi:hypothetical protein